MKTFLSMVATLAMLVIALPVEAKLNVVATTPDFGAVAKIIGGDRVEVTTLARPSEDAHFVDAKPSFIVKLNRADVLIEGGAELELGWLPALLQSARNSRIAVGAAGRVVANEGVTMLDVPESLDRSKGDIHAAGNPHYMVDPENAKIVAAHVAEAFCAVDPPGCDVYRANQKRFAEKIDSKLVEWKRKLEPFKGRRIVSYHDSWPYFAKRFGVRIDLFLEPKPGIPPTPAHLAEVMSTMKRENIGVILSDPYMNRRTAETVARNTGATVVDVAQFPGGVKGTGDGYIELMDYLVDSIARALAARD